VIAFCSKHDYYFSFKTFYFSEFQNPAAPKKQSYKY
jgi:hypothetical protein